LAAGRATFTAFARGTELTELIEEVTERMIGREIGELEVEILNRLTPGLRAFNNDGDDRGLHRLNEIGKARRIGYCRNLDLRGLLNLGRSYRSRSGKKSRTAAETDEDGQGRRPNPAPVPRKEG
jgi:hypothetical protein